MNTINWSFHLDPLQVPIEQLLPLKTLNRTIIYTKKFRQIKASIEEVGIIEPLCVATTGSSSSHYMLLDGHLRLYILKELGHATAPCILSMDDESYTYNNHVNRLSTIQEHKMIKRALDRGVNTERLAKALNLEIKSILMKANLLNGICPEVIDQLKNRYISSHIFSILRKMKPLRQMECVDCMISSNFTTVSYAKALLLATPEQMLIGKRKGGKTTQGLTPEQITKMDIEMSNLQIQYKALEQSYGQDILNLVVAVGYLNKLLSNELVYEFLRKHHPEILSGFESLIKNNSLE